MTAPASQPLELAVIACDQAPDLEVAVRRLHDRCRMTAGPLRNARITIVDNGSTDGTWLAAQALAAELDGVASRRTDERLGPKALRGLMADSDADVVAFLRVGPESDLGALLAPLAALRRPLPRPRSEACRAVRCSPPLRAAPDSSPCSSRAPARDRRRPARRPRSRVRPRRDRLPRPEPVLQSRSPPR
jgi:glycosyltransferase involved in cell wall biosynthesis